MSLSFANNKFSFNNDGDVTFGSSEDNLRVFFVKKGEEMSDVMKLSYEAIKEKHNITCDDFVKIITEEACLNMPKANVKSGAMKLFIFEDFNDTNEAFNYIKSIEKVYVFGPRALLSIILEGISTLIGNYHIHNMTMRNSIITSTNISPKEKKKNIKKLVEYMGGQYLNDLTSRVTHLVSEGVGSEKYEKAGKIEKIKLMHSDWIFHLWKVSQVQAQMSADESQFDRFKLPIFLNLTITSTGINVNKRDEIKTIVDENGGKYSPNFNSKVDILLVDPSAIGEKKHEAAIKLKKTCLSSEWIYESLRCNYAVCLNDFKIEPKKAVKASTPTKSNATVSKFNPDNTQLSEISYCVRGEVSFAETVVSTTSRVTRSSFASNVSVRAEEPQTMFTTQNFNDARKIGNILDGYNVYLDGITKKDLQILNKILTCLGAMKFDKIGHNITHVFVGEMSNDLFKKLEDNGVEPIVLHIDWLKKVLNSKSIVDEKDFEISNTKSKRTIEMPSPASKKMIRSMSNNFKKPQVPPKLQFDQIEPEPEPEPEEDLVNQYLVPQGQEQESQISSLSGDLTAKPFLTGKSIFIYGFNDPKESTLVIEMCEKYGATLVDSTYKREVDYVICPFQADNLEIAVSYKCLISEQWLLHCEEQDQLLPYEFYYHPILKDSKMPLKGEIFSITNYKGIARSYVKDLIKNLGGIGREILKKVDKPIVVTDSPTGAKFESAKNWEFTCLTVEWLIACNINQQRVDETPYLIGGTKPSSRNMIPSKRLSVVPSSQFEESFDVYDPPIENIIEEPEPVPLPEQSCEPSKVGKPHPVIQEFINEMPTPIRKVTLSALNMNESKKVSPNRPIFNKKIPKSPEFSKASPKQKEIRIRPDETPNTRELHKRRLEALDSCYDEPSDKRQKTASSFPELPDPSPPYRYVRHDFFRRKLSDYNSPDPRSVDEAKYANPPMATKLTFNDNMTENNDETEGINCFAELAKEKPVEKKRFIPPHTQLTEEINYHPAAANFVNQFESENLVEWDSGSQHYSQNDDHSSQPIPKSFCFSLVNENQRESLTKIVENLGGKMDSSNFTHLITPKPTKGEKYLTGIAKGCYLLHPKYLLKCQESKLFVNEDSFEFGNPSIDAVFSQKIDDDLASAGYRWRQWIKITHRDRFTNGAFTNVRFIMMVLNEKGEQLTNVIVGGGGQKIDIKLTSNTSVDDITKQNVNYCFEDGKKPLSNNIKTILKQANVKILLTTAILNYLMSKDVPNNI